MFIILIGTRLPMFLGDVPVIEPEILWLVLGEKLAAGANMYSDVWDITEPLSAGVYFITDLIFGKSVTAQRGLALIITALQALIINYIFETNSIYKERNMFPAFIYILFSALFFDFYVLSPALMGTTFLILSAHFIFLQIRQRPNNEMMLYTGLLTGIATLFHFPYAYFILLPLFAFSFYRAPRVRHYFLLITGYVLPTLTALVWYFLAGDPLAYLKFSIFSYFTIDAELLVEPRTMFLVALLPVIFLFFSFTTIASRATYINYQFKAIRIMMVWILLSIFVLFSVVNITPYQLWVFIPAISFFFSHYFLLARQKKIANLILITAVAGVMLLNTGTLYGFLNKTNPYKLDNLIAGSPSTEPSVELQGRKILVLGEDYSLYKESMLASPYLNWDLSKRLFLNVNDLHTAAEIHRGLMSDLPEIIVDERNIFPAVRKIIPALDTLYRKLPDEPVYILEEDSENQEL